MPRIPVLAALLAVPLALAAGGCDGGDTSGGDALPGALSAAATPGAAASAPAVVERVVDGDTLVADVDGDRARVRLLGIDTPETVKPDAPVECYGPQASARTKALLPEGVRVVLQTDPVAGAQDDFGRVLAYVTPQGARLTVNEELLREGFATLFVFDRAHPFTRVAAFRAAERSARGARLGLWGSCPLPAR
ncbi:MAG: thermonuclease family protein [Thermoleophilia bacterium]|nr:thermonuclease family protein [Thermoleophilia bacterium]